MLNLGVVLSNPCLCYAEETTVGAFRHGDDFVVFGSRSQTATFRCLRDQELILESRGVLGPTKVMGDVSEIMVLNRICRKVTRAATERERIEMEPTRAMFRSWHSDLDSTSRVVQLHRRDTHRRVLLL